MVDTSDKQETLRQAPASARAPRAASAWRSRAAAAAAPSAAPIDAPGWRQYYSIKIETSKMAIAGRRGQPHGGCAMSPLLQTSVETGPTPPDFYAPIAADLEEVERI